MILGIGGKLESGKDTLADYLVDNYGYKKMAFADNLKQICMKVFGLTHDQCYTTEGKFKKFQEPMVLFNDDVAEIIIWLRNTNNLNITDEIILKMNSFVGKEFDSPRTVLQFVGTEIMRDCVDPDIHAKTVFNQIEREGLKNVIIADARFANERKIIKERGGKLVLIDCVQTRDQESTHRSETGLGQPSDYHVTIVNDKALGLIDFCAKINFCVHRLGWNQ